MNCCENQSFKLVEELGRAESVDWDLGRCTGCGAYLLRQWSEYAPGRVFYDQLSDEEAAGFQAAHGIERKSLLKKWYNEH